MIHNHVQQMVPVKKNGKKSRNLIAVLMRTDENQQQT